VSPNHYKKLGANTRHSLESGLGTISETMKCKPTPDTELQNFIKQQLQLLRTEMVKYEDVVAENRKAHDANDTLKKQLEAQQQYCSQLDEQIKAYQQSEEELRARSNQLEHELNDLRDVSHDPETEPSELERGITDLHQQLRKAEEDLQAANARIEKAEQVRQGLEQDGAKYKVCSSSSWVTRNLTPHRKSGKP
jgi:chromosome segregation ATPase